MLHVVMKNSSKWPMVPSTYSKIFRSNVRKIQTLEEFGKNIKFFFENVFVRFVLQFSSEIKNLEWLSNCLEKGFLFIRAQKFKPLPFLEIDSIFNLDPF